MWLNPPRKGSATCGVALALYKDLSATPENLLFSPYSISIALATLQLGARGVTRREIEERHWRLAEQRAELYRRELAFAKEHMAQEAKAQEDKVRAEIERLHAAGETQQAEFLEQHARVVSERMDLRRRELELQQARIAEQRAREKALQSAAEKLRAVERGCGSWTSETNRPPATWPRLPAASVARWEFVPSAGLWPTPTR